MTSIPNIQEFLIPRRPSSKYGSVEVAHLWHPLDDIGGDYLYYEQVDNQFLSIEIGDVIGHGTHSGLVMTALHGLLFGLRQELIPLDTMLSNANDFLWRLTQMQNSHDPDNTAQLLCSMFLMRVDVKNRIMTYCNAGHPAALYLPSTAEAEIMSLQTGGIILGAIPGAQYHASPLRPAAGDTVLLFTDGLSEARGATGDEFGTARLEKLLREFRTLKPREIVEQLRRRVSEHWGEAPSTDDVSIAVIQFGSKW
jgi:serine phosphatase RsbU (regulator of sigma subunit)